LKTTNGLSKPIQEGAGQRESKVSTITTTKSGRKRRRKRAMAMKTRAMAYFSKRSTVQNYASVHEQTLLAMDLCKWCPGEREREREYVYHNIRRMLIKKSAYT
jgi:hypothetical protein